MLEQENIEYTYVMLKPDGVQKGLLGEVINRFLQASLTVNYVKEFSMTEEQVCEHYAHLLEKPFFPVLASFMLSGPVISMIVSGSDAILKVRTLMGSTDSKEANPGTIRGDYGDKTCCTYNIIHGSDGKESAIAEIMRFYPELSITEFYPEQNQLEKTGRQKMRKYQKIGDE